MRKNIHKKKVQIIYFNTKQFTRMILVSKLKSYINVTKAKVLNISHLQQLKISIFKTYTYIHFKLSEEYKNKMHYSHQNMYF